MVIVGVQYVVDMAELLQRTDELVKGDTRAN